MERNLFERSKPMPRAILSLQILFRLMKCIPHRAGRGGGFGVLAVLTLAAVLGNSVSSLAQGPKEPPDLTLDAALRSQVIQGAVKALNEHYVFPEVAQQMEKSLRERQQRKEYENITSAVTLAKVLTEHLQEISHDKHLRMFYSHSPIPVHEEGRKATAEERERQRYMSSL